MSAKREEIDPELLSRSAYTSIGQFNVSKGRLIVSDPRYEVASEDYDSIAELIGFSVHTSAEGQACILDGRCSWEQQQMLGVDSAMMGIFDFKFYKANGAVKGKDLDAGLSTASNSSSKYRPFHQGFTPDEKPRQIHFPAYRTSISPLVTRVT
eukprot:gene14380-10277_t